MKLSDIDLDEVMPNGKTRRQMVEEYQARQEGKADTTTERGPFDPAASIGLLNVAMWLTFAAALVLVIMGINAGPVYGAGFIGLGVGTAISGVLIKGLSAIVVLLRDIRDQ